MNFTIDKVLQIVYIVIFLFVLKQIYTGIKVKRSIKGKVVAEFIPKMKILVGILIVGLFVLGATFVINKDYFGIVYLLTGLGFIYIYSSKVTIYTTGIYYNARMDEWTEIKKWDYDYKNSNIRLETTKPGNKSFRAIPLKREDSDQVLALIKSRKSKKKVKNK